MLVRAGGCNAQMRDDSADPASTRANLRATCDRSPHPLRYDTALHEHHYLPNYAYTETIDQVLSYKLGTFNVKCFPTNYLSLEIVKKDNFALL